MLTGINPRLVADANIVEEIGDEVGCEDLPALHRRVSAKITSTQSKARHHFDLKCKVKIFQTNDLVMVKRISTISTGQSTKLQPNFKGPFRISKVLPNDRYLVQDL